MTVPESKDPGNPKDLIGSKKMPMHLWPASATMYGVIGLLDGAAKYGRANWRVSKVRATIYFDAALRHFYAWFEGEEFDPDSKLPHLAHAIACMAIMIDATACGTLVDDRNVNGKGNYRNLIDKLTPHVARLHALHEGKDPKHYSFADNDLMDLTYKLVEERAAA